MHVGQLCKLIHTNTDNNTNTSTNCGDFCTFKNEFNGLQYYKFKLSETKFITVSQYCNPVISFLKVQKSSNLRFQEKQLYSNSLS